MAVIPANQYPLMSVYFRDSLRKEETMTSTVYIVTRPRENKFGWTPDLTDAARYGKLKIVFEPEDSQKGYERV